MLSSYWQTMRNFNHDVRIYLFLSFLIGISYLGVVTVLLNLYLLRLGYGTEFIGIVNASTALAFASFSLPAGIVGRRIGSRRVMVLGVFLLTVSTSLLPMAETLPSRFQEVGILIARAMTGAGFAFFIVNTYPALTAATKHEERDLAFSLQVALSPVAGFVGSLMGGVMPGIFASLLSVSLDDPSPYRYPLFVSGAMLIPGIFALMTTTDISLGNEVGSKDKDAGNTANKTKQRTGKDQPTENVSSVYMLIAILSVVAYLRMSGEGAARSFFNVYLDTEMGVATERIGLLAAIGQLMAGPAALIAPYMVLRLGRVTTVVIGTLGTATSLLLMAMVPHWIAVGIGFMGVIAALSIARSTVNVIHMEIVAPKWRSTMSGVTSMAMGMGFSSMALGGGYLIPIAGYKGLFLVGMCLAIGSASLFWFYFRVPRGEYATEQM
ncbi:MAG: MFS transporter [Chloroflexota bacterium]